MNIPRIRPKRTVVASFGSHIASSSQEFGSINESGFEECHYVLHLASAPGNNQTSHLSCALSNLTIQSYDCETLKNTHTIKNPHKERITDLSHAQIASSGDATNCPLVVSSSEDKFVKIFDLRTDASHPAVCMNLIKEQALSVSIGYGGSLAAVGGSKGHIHFYDLRNISSTNVNTPLGSYVDAHTEEVTKVRFQQCQNNSNDTTPIMVTASEDGLVNIFDTSKPSEESALKSVLNIQSPLREVGFFGPSLEGIFCLTGSETFSVWHYDSAQRIADFGDARTTLSSIADIPLQYMIGCLWDGQDLNLLSGNVDGDCAMFKVDAGGMSIKRILSGGHKSCLRSFTSLKSNLIITGGEDSRLCEWGLNDNIDSDRSDHPKFSRKSFEMNVSEDDLPKAGGGVIRKHKKKKGQTPY